MRRTRPRGHSSLIGALDAQIAVSRDDQNNIVVLVEYLKDGEDGPDGLKLVSRLQVVDLGAGDEISSCIVVPADDTEAVTTTSAPRAFDRRRSPRARS